jgi:hypothetical protein
MSLYTHIKRCLELSDRDIVTAIADRRLAKGLLDHLAKISKPGDGAPKLLLMFSKMAAQQVDWVDGALRIEMIGDNDATVVEVLCELGLGMHERVFPSFRMNVPLEEFARAVERVPHMIEPLAIQNKSGRRLVLTADGGEDEVKVSTPPSVSIGDDSLYVGVGAKSKPPQVTLEPAPPRRHSSGKHRAVRTKSRPDLPAVQPKVISPVTGKTLRPAPHIAKKAPPPLPPDSEEPASQAPTRLAKHDSQAPTRLA